MAFYKRWFLNSRRPKVRKALFSVFIISGLFFCPVTIADTPVSGFITGHEVWDVSGSPYVLVGNVTVQEGASLTIDPNTQVQIYSGSSTFKRIIVYGHLSARGCEFILETNGLNPSYISLSNTGLLDQCQITTSSGGIVRITSTEVLMTQCTGEAATVDIYKGSPTIQSNTIGHVIVRNTGSPTIQSNTVLSSVTIEDDAAPLFQSNTCHATIILSTSQAAQIQGNTFTNQYPYDLSLGSPWTGISGNTFEHESPIFGLHGTAQSSRTLGELEGIATYIVRQGISVAPGASLTIETDTEIICTVTCRYLSCRGATITVYGTLITQGCTITLDATCGCRASISFYDGGKGDLNNSHFPGGGLINIASSNVSVTDCNLFSSIIIAAGAPNIQHNDIHSTIEIVTDQAAQVNANTVYAPTPYNLLINSPTSGISGNTYEYASPAFGLYGTLEASKTISPIDDINRVNVTHTIMIPDQNSLTIERGMYFSASGGGSGAQKSIYVYGDLNAQQCSFSLYGSQNPGTITFYYATGKIDRSEVSGNGSIRIMYSDEVTVSDCEINCGLTITSSSPTITGNEFLSCNLICYGSAAPSIIYNEFTNGSPAILAEDNATPEIHYNSFNPNRFGVNNTGSRIVDATYNWWGDPTGPGPVGPGNGANVSENVIYEPWLGGEICKVKGVVRYDDNGQQPPVAGIPVYVYQQGAPGPVWQGTTDNSGRYEASAYNNNYDLDGPQRFQTEAKWEDEVVKVEDDLAPEGGVFLDLREIIHFNWPDLINEIQPPYYEECSQLAPLLNLTFDDSDASDDYLDATAVFNHIHEANSFISRNFRYRPSKVTVLIHAIIPNFDHDYVPDQKKIRFEQALPTRGNGSTVWHEYAHAVHDQKIDDLRGIDQGFAEGWAMFFMWLNDEFDAYTQLERNFKFEQTLQRDDNNHRWGTVYSGIFYDISDGYHGFPVNITDDDPINGENTGYPDKGNVMVWKVVMEDQATTIDDFFEKFLDRYLELQLSLFAIYNSHGLYLTTTPTTTNQILQTQTQTTTTTTDSSIAKGKFFLSWPGSDLDLTLTAPDTSLIDPCYAASDPNVTYVEDANTEYYLIDNPQPGQWQMHIEAVNVPPEGEIYTATAYLTTNLVLILSTDKQTYDSNEPISLTAKLLYDANSYSDANVIAEIKKPDGNETIILYDDGLHNDANAGDGIYANTYSNTSTEGDYEIIATSSGRNPFNEPFVRQTSKTVLVQNLPDLVPTDLTTTNDLLQGQISLTATILNTGSAHANDILVEFYDVTDTNVARIEPNTTIDYLEPNQSQQVSVIWDANFGTHHIFVVVDPNNETVEKDEVNNYISEPFSIGCIFRADFNNDWFVTLKDLAELVDYWVDPCPIDEWCQGRDLNQSGEVDFADFAILSTEYSLEHCPP